MVPILHAVARNGRHPEAFRPWCERSRWSGVMDALASENARRNASDARAARPCLPLADGPRTARICGSVTSGTRYPEPTGKPS